MLRWGLYIALFLSSQLALAVCPAVKALKNFSVDERTLVPPKTKKNTLTYRNSRHEIIATAEQAAWSWGVEVKVFDCDNARIGTIKEHVMRGKHKAHAIYQVLDADDRLVGESEKIDLIGAPITLKDSAGTQLAKLEKAPLSADNELWQVRAEDTKTLDWRLLIFVAGYKAGADKHRKLEALKAQRSTPH